MLLFMVLKVYNNEMHSNNVMIEFPYGVLIIWHIPITSTAVVGMEDFSLLQT
eukprot:SAG31_NODE_10800_length_1096_cov_1.100301_1_plen_52_part_00